MALPLARPTVASTASALCAVAPLLLALACSAPPGTEDDTNSVPPYPTSTPGGAPAASTNGLQPAPNNPVTGSAVSANGAGGTAGTEAPGTNGVGLSPMPMAGGSQNTNMGQQLGAAGASTGAAGASSGAAGASNGAAGTSGALPAGSAGSSAMPPTENTPPPVTPPPVTPPPVTPPPVVPPPVTPPPAANANCPGQFLCENFEGVAAGASPSPSTWQVIANYSPVAQNAAIQVSTAQAHSGQKSLHVAASGSRNGIVATLPQNRYFLRAWLQVEAVPLGPVFIGLGTDQNSETRLRIQGRSFGVINIVGSGQDGVIPNAATSGNCPGCVTLTPNRWFCAEFSIDNAARAATLWIDGVEAANIINGQGGFAAQPAMPKLFLGSMGLQGGQAGVFIDDVAVGSTRIGCN